MDKAKTEKLFAELSEEMATWKRPWNDLARTYEQFRCEDRVEEAKGEYRRTQDQRDEGKKEMKSYDEKQRLL